jgi:hypothetical protein
VRKAPHALNLVIRDAGYAALPKNKVKDMELLNNQLKWLLSNSFLLYEKYKSIDF